MALSLGTGEGIPLDQLTRLREISMEAKVLVGLQKAGWMDEMHPVEVVTRIPGTVARRACGRRHAPASVAGRLRHPPQG